MNAIHVPVVFDSFNRRKDMSVGMRMTTTANIDSEQFASFDRLVNSAGWALLSPNPIQEYEVPSEAAPDKGLKTQSQRLRNVLFVLWKQEGEHGLFEQYYQTTMESIIAMFKEQLEDR